MKLDVSLSSKINIFRMRLVTKYPLRKPWTTVTWKKEREKKKEKNEKGSASKDREEGRDQFSSKDKQTEGIISTIPVPAPSQQGKSKCLGIK